MSQKKDLCSSGGFVWSRELTANLIILYEQHPELYKVNTRTYQNRNARQLGLQDISNNLNRMHFTSLGAADISKKLHGLRTTFLQELNKIRKSESSGASADGIYVSKWWCFEQLQFLRDHGVVVHQGSSNLLAADEQPSQESEDIQIVFDGPIEDISNTPLMSPSSSRSHSRPESRLSENDDLSVPKKKKIETSQVRDKNTSNIQEVLSSATVALNDLKAKKKDPTNSNQLFGQMIALEMDKVENEEILDTLKEEILAAVFSAKRRSKK